MNVAEGLGSHDRCDYVKIGCGRGESIEPSGVGGWMVCGAVTVEHRDPTRTILGDATPRVGEPDGRR